ncbi:unnamed protein product, partial [Polarella glacialis]
RPTFQLDRPSCRLVFAVSCSAFFLRCGGNPECFVDGTAYIFEICCSPPYVGNPGCWAAGYNWGLCCEPEIQRRTEAGMKLLQDGFFRRASEELFDVSMNYAGPTSLAFEGFQKAAKEYKSVLDTAADSLSLHEVLIGGMQIDCPVGTAVETALQSYNRCCPDWFFTGTVECTKAYEMIQNALGWGRHKNNSEAQDEYYK